jgi:hypothetical protein
MKLWALFSCAALVLLGGPILGVWLAGKPLGPYLELPPRPLSVEAPAFSWAAFTFMLAFIVGVITPFAWRFLSAPPTKNISMQSGRPLPDWGWAALLLVGASWTLAWTRFTWFEPLQSHTFTPLWLGYIGVVNALTVRRKGSSILTGQPARFALLFPVSALFWWFFEYLNRFVSNWHYVGVSDFSPFEYALFASVSFSTVLPAVASTAEWIGTFQRLHDAFGRWRPLRLLQLKAVAASVLGATALSLVGLAILPELLYPLVWISPVLVIVSLQALGGHPTVFAPLKHGDWQELVCYAAAALVCGFFWEMWNYGSLAHWEYAVPYVGQFRIFEMPLLGYAGYLPFGIECAVISNLVLRQRACPQMTPPRKYA